MAGRRPLFGLGRIVATPGALAAMEETREAPGGFIARHVGGDWGDLGAEDRALNDAAVAAGDRILSAYRLADRTRIWIITERDRSVTTILLPEEY